MLLHIFAYITREVLKAWWSSGASKGNEIGRRNRGGSLRWKVGKGPSTGEGLAHGL